LEAASGHPAARIAAQQSPELIVLDPGLADIDGKDALRQMRKWLEAPIINLSTRDQGKQKVTALDHGADDYVTKPFSKG
jgi:two-component system KDP operon response regulator KdpE